MHVNSGTKGGHLSPIAKLMPSGRSQFRQLFLSASAALPIQREHLRAGSLVENSIEYGERMSKGDRA